MLKVGGKKEKRQMWECRCQFKLEPARDIGG